MIDIRRGSERGRTHTDWLDSYHSFSFGDYFSAERLNFGVLRVINDDRIAPGGGFPTHGHRDMEIITYVLEGALEHKDSLGNGSVVRAGDVQRMSAGTGIRHSEFNPSRTEPVHFLQIWIEPRCVGMPPSYEQTPVPDSDKLDRLRLIACPDGAAGSLKILQDARVYTSLLGAGRSVEYPLEPGRSAYVHIACGSLRLNRAPLEAGDAAAVNDEANVVIEAIEPAELLLFDLP